MGVELTENSNTVIQRNNDRLSIAREHSRIVGVASSEFVGVSMDEEEHRQLAGGVVICGGEGEK